MNWYSEIKQRWSSETPEFWVKIRNFTVTLGTSAVAVIGADKLFDLRGYGVPLEVFTLCGYIIVACFAFGLAAQITKK